MNDICFGCKANLRGANIEPKFLGTSPAARTRNFTHQNGFMSLQERGRCNLLGSVSTYKPLPGPLYSMYYTGRLGSVQRFWGMILRTFGVHVMNLDPKRVAFWALCLGIWAMSLHVLAPGYLPYCTANQETLRNLPQP